jgi:hypothetical protein
MYPLSSSTNFLSSPKFCFLLHLRLVGSTAHDVPSIAINGSLPAIAMYVNTSSLRIRKNFSGFMISTVPGHEDRNPLRRHPLGVRRSAGRSVLIVSQSLHEF